MSGNFDKLKTMQEIGFSDVRRAEIENVAVLNDEIAERSSWFLDVCRIVIENAAVLETEVTERLN